MQKPTAHAVSMDMPFRSISVMLLGMQVLGAVCTFLDRQTSQGVLGISAGLDLDRRARVFEDYGAFGHRWEIHQVIH